MTREQLLQRKKELLLEKRELLLRKEEPEPEESSLRSAGRAVARTAKDIGAGIGDFTTPFTEPVREAINYPLRRAGVNYQIPQLGEEINRATDVATNNFTAPKTNTEKNISTGIRFVGPIGAGTATNLASKAATTGAKHISKLSQRTKDLLQMGNAPTPGNIGSSVASGAAMQHVLNEDPENALGALGAAFGVGAGTQAAPLLKNTIANAGKKVFAINPEKVSTMDKVGVPLSIGDASDNAVVKKIQNAINNMTLADSKLSKNFTQLSNVIKEKLGLPKSGIVRNEGQVGEYSKQAIDTLEDHVSNIYDTLQEKAIKALMANSENKKIPIKEAAAFIQNFISKELENNKTLEKIFKASPAGKSFFEMIEPAAREGLANPEKAALIKKLTKENYDPKLIQDIVAKEFPEVATEDLSLPYKGLKYLRTMIGTKGRASFGQISNQQEGHLKDLYGAVSRDIGNQIEQVGGPKARKWWGLSNDVWSRFKKKSDAHLDPFLSIVKNQPKEAPYLIARDLGNKGELFRLITPYLKKHEKGEFLQGVIGALGEKDGAFNYGKFATSVNHLGDSEKTMFFKALAKENGVDPKDIKNIIDVIDYSKETLAQANTSQTAQHTELYNKMKDIGKFFAGALAGKAAGITGLATTAAGLTGIWAANKHLFANPKAIRAMAYAGKMTSAKQVPTWINKLSQIPGFPKDMVKGLTSIYMQEISKGQGYTGTAIIGKSAKRTLQNVQQIREKEKR